MSGMTNRRATEPVILLQFEGLRGVAALAVFAYHLHHVPALDDVTDRLPGFFSSGWVFVDLFFILSGWVMGHAYYEKLRVGGTGGVRQFLVARVARLYPLHIATLIVWVALFGLGSSSGGSTTVVQCLPQLLSLSFTWGPLACPPPVAPAWSISAEASVYLLFPALVMAGMARSTARATALLVAGVACYAGLALTDHGIHVIDGMAPLRALAGFLVGLALWKINQAGALLRGPLATILQWVSVPLLCVLFFVEAAPFAMVITIALTVASLREASGPLARLLCHPVLTHLGQLSYGIYLWHWFAIVALGTLTLESGATITVIGAGLLVVIWSHVSYVWLEAPARRAIRASAARHTSRATNVRAEIHAHRL